ncbi:hypothetical protein [Metallibacterium scheffleri]|uniref:hypothetical protein n=1 Tax=Metallibacterium scheffleri TaxID=993689 RepID=UPI0023F14F7B|nr:hypothetical protein [Metallibacterium scheffleri]
MGGVKHQITIGRTREVRGPDALEQGFAGMVIAVAMVIAVWFGIQLAQMTQTLDAVSVAGGPQINAVIYHAVHGRWPSSRNRDIVAADSNGNYVEHLALGEGGVITAELRLGPALGVLTGHGARLPSSIHGFLSFRPELLGSKDAPSISFLCGYAKPVAGAIETTTANRTTLPKKYLPPFCR